MTDFDAEELFHLGLKASEQGDKERSISFFKRAIELEPDPASYYLLGAEYAETYDVQAGVHPDSCRQRP